MWAEPCAVLSWRRPPSLPAEGRERGGRGTSRAGGWGNASEVEGGGCQSKPAEGGSDKRRNLA